MRSFSIRLFSPSVATDGFLVASRYEWPMRAVIRLSALAGKVDGRKEYPQPGIYTPVSSKRIYTAHCSDMALRQLCEARVINKTREGLMLDKDLFFSFGSTAAAVAHGAISNADWWKSSHGKPLGNYIHEAKAKT